VTSPEAAESPRSYGCTFGCGAPYDIIIIDVTDGVAHMLCVPCYIKLANDMISAMLNESDPETREALMLAIATRGEQAPGPSGRKRGKNAPATASDPDLIESFDAFSSLDDDLGWKD
jgi:hypothetical protein